MKKILMLMGISLVLLTGCVKTDDECFTVDQGTILKYDKKCGSEVNVPSKINGNEITKIGDFAFMRMGIISVKLPNTVTEIGVGAFETNKLIKINLPNNLKSIGANAFWENKLTSLSIPSSVTSVGTKAFNNNQLKDKDAFIYGYVKNKLDKTTVISYGGKNTDVVLPDTVLTIAASAFADSNIKVVNLSKVVTIQRGAFASNNITKITIPKTVINIEDLILVGNPLEQVTIQGKKSLTEFNSGAGVDLTGDKKFRREESEVKYIFN